MITVLDINEIPPTTLDGVRVADFLTAQTVGAELVAGSSCELDPGATVGPLDGQGAFQLFYVTDGEPVADFGGQKHQLRAGQGVYCDRDEVCAFENPTDAVATFLRFVVADTT
jgi:quercetin dioxygenase-like cupin family protein